MVWARTCLTRVDLLYPAGVAQQLLGTLELQYQNKTISLQRPWRRATMHELVKEVRQSRCRQDAGEKGAGVTGCPASPTTTRAYE